jgi:hypothetical protein
MLTRARRLPIPGHRYQTAGDGDRKQGEHHGLAPTERSSRYRVPHDRRAVAPLPWGRRGAGG